MKGFICNSKNIDRDAYIWNTIAAMGNSFQTMLLMLVITRVGNMADASIFAIAYAIGNLMMSFGKYGMRNYQVTDVENNYNYYSYVYSRFITTFLMLMASCIYIGVGAIFSHYSLYKAVCIGLICLIKGIDTLEDVIHGRLQQKGRLDIASKILGIRMLTYIVLFICLYISIQKLLLTELICFLISIVIAVYCNRIAIKEGYVEEGNLDRKEDLKDGVLGLFKSCFPLAASTFLVMYLGNAPKYMIDSVVSDEVQAGFNIVFMPVFVITLLSSFIFNPILGKVAYYWNRYDYKSFSKLIRRQSAFIVGITIFAVLFAWGPGIPILSWIYKVNLREYRGHLCILMLAGGVLAFLNLFNMVITAMRKQQVLLWVFGGGTLIMLLLGRMILKAHGLFKLCIFYCLGLMMVCGVLISISIYNVKGRKS